MLLAANCWTASMTMASSLIRNSMLLYPLSLAASAAVVTLANALAEAGAAMRAAVVRTAMGAILDNILLGVFGTYCSNNKMVGLVFKNEVMKLRWDKTDRDIPFPLHTLQRR